MWNNAEDGERQWDINTQKPGMGGSQWRVKWTVEIMRTLHEDLIAAFPFVNGDDIPFSVSVQSLMPSLVISLCVSVCVCHCMHSGSAKPCLDSRCQCEIYCSDWKWERVSHLANKCCHDFNGSRFFFFSGHHERQCEYTWFHWATFAPFIPSLCGVGIRGLSLRVYLPTGTVVGKVIFRTEGCACENMQATVLNSQPYVSERVASFIIPQFVLQS